MSLSKLIRSRMRVLFVGPPGCGKTARIAAAAHAANHGFVVMRASLSERIDFGGALVPDAAAGVTRELPLERLHALQRTDEPTLLLLDDLGQAPIDVQAACMRLFDDGYLPPNVLIWGATNRPGDKAGVSALCEPLRSRFDLAYAMPTPPQPETAGAAPKAASSAQQLHPWTVELDEWCSWALSHDVSPTIVAWHRATTGRTLYQWTPCADPAHRMADYRTWDAAARLIGAKLDDLSTLSACLGAPVAVEFAAFTALTDKTPGIDEIAMSPDTCAVPDDPSSLWLVATALGAAMSPDNVEPLLVYLGRIPRVYGALAARDAYRRCGADLARTPAWSEWFVSNQELFR